MDRSKAPQVNILSEIDIPSISHFKLDSGIDVYYVESTESEAFKIEAVHQSGFIQMPSASASSLLSKMLLEGTKDFPGKLFLEEIDALGSFIESTPGFDSATISLFGLSRYFKRNVALLASALYRAEMKESRLDFLKKKEINRVKLNLEKGSYLTSTQLRKNLFDSHPYGYTSSIDDINNQGIKTLKTFSQTRSMSFSLFLSGKLPSDFKQILNSLFPVKGNYEQKPSELKWPDESVRTIDRNEKFIQSSIRLGARLFNRKHEDYSGFMLLNEILGGFFGSRLMKNIREDKGYTYGIGSSLYALNEIGYFTIGTEVNHEAEEDTLIQIEHEINRLKEEPVSTEELLVVKNYFLGTFANSWSAPFATIDKFKGLHAQGLDLSFYATHLAKIKNIDQDDLLRLANNYLHFDKMCLATVGKA